MEEIREEEERAAEAERLRVDDPDLLTAMERSQVTTLPDYPYSQTDEAERVAFALQASAAEAAVSAVAESDDDERITDTPVLCPPCLGGANGAHQREVAPRSALPCAALRSARLVRATTRDHAALEVAAARVDIGL